MHRALGYGEFFNNFNVACSKLLAMDQSLGRDPIPVPLATGHCGSSVGLLEPNSPTPVINPRANIDVPIKQPKSN